MLMRFSVYLKIDNETTSVMKSVVSSLAFLLTITIIQSADIQSQLFNPCAAEVSGATFRHLKLEFPMQFPASNDEKIFPITKNRHLRNEFILPTEHSRQNIPANT